MKYTAKLFNVYWTYEDGTKAFAFDLEILKQTANYIFAKSNLYGDIYKLCKYTNSLEINGDFVGTAIMWSTEGGAA